MPRSICLHHCLWGDLTKFCGPFKSIYSSADSSLSPLIYPSHSPLPSIPWPPYAQFCLFIHLFPALPRHPSFSFLYPSLFHSFYFSPSLFTRYIYRIPILNISFMCLFSSLSLLPSQLSLPPFLPLSFSHSVCMALFYSLGEMNRNWFLPITSQASPETEKNAPVKDYEADP